MARLWQAVARWAGQFWDDLKNSTDAGLLAVARFLGLLYGPIDARLPIGQALSKALQYRLAPQVGWRHALGGIAYLLFILLVLTGVLLAVHYRPSAQEAYPSLQHITSDVTLGWLFRDMHVWSANLVVVAMLAHMGRVFVDAAYKPPRETNWLVGVLLLFLVVAFGATGSLLPWDQWAYWTTTRGLSVVEGIPLGGRMAAGLLRGDPIVSGATLSRFFAAHVIVLPWMALALLGFHFAMVRRHGVAPLRHPSGPASSGRSFFPNHLLRSFMVATLVCALVITVSVLAPRPIGDPANPEQAPATVHTTWLVADVARALTHYLGSWGVAGFTLLTLGLALVPLFDRGPEHELRRRPLVAGLGLVFLLVFMAAWLAGRELRSASTFSAFTPPLRATSTPTPGAQAPTRQGTGSALPAARRDSAGSPGPAR